MPPKRQAAIGNPSSSPDRGADYNAFGRDPDGRLAYLSAWLWGPNYVPLHTVQQFVGTPEPPRYGPPAPYQRPYLPPGWTPTPSPYAVQYGVPAASDLDFDLPGPTHFQPGWLDALRNVRRFKKQVSKKGRKTGAEQGGETGYETDIEEECSAEEDMTKKRRGFPPRPPPPPPPPAIVP